jgi:hypothetical protein
VAEPKLHTREALAERQAGIRKKVLRKTGARKQPMQTKRELEEIPDGSEVIIHLLRSASRAIPEHREGLVAFGLLENKRRGKKRQLPSGHIGRTARRKWRPEYASARVQQLTRYMYVDQMGSDELPGSGSVTASESKSDDDMSVDHYKTSRKKPAVFVTPKDGRGVQIESQPDGFGMTWATQLDALAAVEHALSVLSRPKKDDEAVLVIDSGPPKSLLASEVVDLLSENRGHVSLVRMDIGAASLAWADAAKERRMSFGDDLYARPVLRKLLEHTADLPGDGTLDRLLDVADDVLQANTSSQS